MYRKISALLIYIVVVTTFVLSISGCVQYENAEPEKTPKIKVVYSSPEEQFAANQMRFDLDILKAVVSAEVSAGNAGNMNILVSPLSVQLVLAMTANGAGGTTLHEMTELTAGDFTIEDFNEHINRYIDSLQTGEDYTLKIADSMWINGSENKINIKEAFIKKNADHYGAEIFRLPFDRQTVNEINKWVRENTDGIIENFIDNEDFDESDVLCLINTFMFDAMWEVPFGENAMGEGIFTNMSGVKQNTEYMTSREENYLDDGSAIGFIKDYAGGKYSFAALIPNEGISVTDYIEGLTPESLFKTLSEPKESAVVITIPKFDCEYFINMNEILKGLGMNEAFDSGMADFTGIEDSGSLYVGKVLHKTHITVDGLGTRAGAAAYSNLTRGPSTHVVLNRPFVYMIIDNQSGFPLFMGIMVDAE